MAYSKMTDSDMSKIIIGSDKSTIKEEKIVLKDQPKKLSISVSVDDIDESADSDEKEKPEEDYRLSARRIKVVQTNFYRPRSSSLAKVKRRFSRGLSVQFDDAPVRVHSDAETNKNDPKENSDIPNGDVPDGPINDQNPEPETSPQSQLTEQDLAELNISLVSKIRKDVNYRNSVILY
eukprot:GFUD01076569.1.p1 GENE.GFUD01076569.1~~GFUD01076569.1.p1  ORF type:complete len:178 (-),score=45.99 GFUD01076569.1:92-625(-)